MPSGIFLDPPAVAGTGAALHTSATKIDGAGRKARTALRNQGCLPPGWSAKANGMISRTSKTGYTADLLSTTGLELKHRASLAAKSQAAGSLGRSSAMPSKGLSPLMKAAVSRKLDPWKQTRPAAIKSPGSTHRAIHNVLSPPKAKPKVEPNDCKVTTKSDAVAKLYHKTAATADRERDFVDGKGTQNKANRKDSFGPQLQAYTERRYECGGSLGDVRGAAAVRVHGETSAEAIIRADKDGLKAKATAGAKAQASAPLSLKIGRLKLIGAPAVAVGAQGGGEVTAGKEDNKFKLGGKISAVLGIGGELGLGFEYDLSPSKSEKPRVINVVVGPDGKLYPVAR